MNTKILNEDDWNWVQNISDDNHWQKTYLMSNKICEKIVIVKWVWSWLRKSFLKQKFLKMQGENIKMAQVEGIEMSSHDRVVQIMEREYLTTQWRRQVERVIQSTHQCLIRESTSKEVIQNVTKTSLLTSSIAWKKYIRRTSRYFVIDWWFYFVRLGRRNLV